MAKYLMGIDAGNTSTKAVLFDVDGNFIAVCQQEREGISPPRPRL